MAATLATVLALASAQPAPAHVDVQPGLVEQGAVAELRVELPQLRPGPPPGRLGVRGAGVRLLDSRLLAVDGVETRWLVHVRVDAAPGPLRMTLRAFYPDDAVFDVDYSLTVVPAPEREGFSWAIAAVGALLAGVAVALLRLARRKAW